MMLFVTWNVTPEIGEWFHISFRWYSLLFALGLFFGGWFLFSRMKKAGFSQSLFESLLVYLFVGLFLGARLVHCLFYEPHYYWEHPLELLLPITQLTDGSFVFSGYHGLASHGGAIGVALALWFYARRYKVSFLQLADYIAIATPLAGGFIRLGNLFNSEIVGAPTTAPWAFVFTVVDAIPRHPAQVYEAVYYFLFFGICCVLYHNKKTFPSGFFLSFVIIGVLVFRFFIEFLKEVQVPFEQAMTLNMGQWLSLPLIVVGAVLMWWVFKHDKSVHFK